MSARKMMPNDTSDASCLVAEAVAHSFALFATVYMASNISGGHVNPAVTFGLAVGGHISIPTAMLYWVAQLVGSTMACLVLRLVTAGQSIPTTAIATEMTGFGGAILESVLTFGLVYTFYAAGDSRRGPLGSIGPIAIGLVAGANVLAAGPFTGGSMNPARSFGSAMISGNFKNQGVYWVGPLIGAGAAGLVYQHVMSPPSSPPDSSHFVAESLVV
ncbi:probable aquaporin TIP5-1 isoform X2 [Magnolia sinica]|uniref:probable aquaporin TIP5-1 isoform X2 n=1 Tax=Magnolia sinica TaxID=86752 RepID=UPI002659D592|nr:probable aquaporin TIP5-1 isoform X2 [Magnolia sinica]